MAKPVLFFVYSSPFLNTMWNIAQNLTVNEVSVDGELGIRTRDRRMVGTDEFSELCRPPLGTIFFVLNRNCVLNFLCLLFDRLGKHLSWNFQTKVWLEECGFVNNVFSYFGTFLRLSVWKGDLNGNFSKLSIFCGFSQNNDKDFSFVLNSLFVPVFCLLNSGPFPASFYLFSSFQYSC